MADLPPKAPIPDDPNLWQEPLQGETPQAFAAYGAYRDLGPRKRTHQAAAQVFYELDELPPRSTAKVNQVARWSTTFHWVKRSAAWDAHVDREARLDQIEAAKAMRERHASIATLALSKAVERLRAATAAELTLDQVARFIETAVRVERQARGEPDQVTHLAGSEGGAVQLDVLGGSMTDERVAELLSRYAALHAADVDDTGTSNI